jgi:pimeloyl-ACP methyl ester carboxylesterase
MPSPVDKFVFVDGIRLHYVEWEGGEPALLMVHGLSANARSFGLWAETLAPKYRLIAPDLRGRGESDKPEGPYGVEVHARDMELLLNALDIDRVVYIGQSLGATIGLQFAANYPDRVLKLMLGDYGGTPDDEAQIAGLWNALHISLARIGTTYPSRDAYLDFWKNNPFFQPMWSKYFESYVEADIEVLPDGTARSKMCKEALEQDTTSLLYLNYENLYPKVRCPTLLVRAPLGILGEKDYALSPTVADRIVRSIPNCRLYEVAGANHFTLFLVEQPELMQEILRFIEE